MAKHTNAVDLKTRLAVAEIKACEKGRSSGSFVHWNNTTPPLKIELESILGGTPRGVNVGEELQI